MCELPVDRTALERRGIELLRKIATCCTEGESPQTLSHYYVVSTCACDVREVAGCFQELGYRPQGDRLLAAFGELNEHWVGGVYRKAPAADALSDFLKKRYTPEKADGRTKLESIQELVYHDAAYPDSVRELGKVARELTDFLEGIRTIANVGSDLKRHCSGDGGEGAEPSASETSLVGYASADALEHDHGIVPERLSEAKQAGKVRSRPAPMKMIDSQGKAVRLLYNIEDAKTHCSPKHVKKKSRILGGKS